VKCESSFYADFSKIAGNAFPSGKKGKEEGNVRDRKERVAGRGPCHFAFLCEMLDTPLAQSLPCN